MVQNYVPKLQCLTPKIAILSYKFIKLNIKHIIMMMEAQNCDFLTYTLSKLSARLGIFIARAHLSQKIPARTHHYVAGSCKGSL